MLAVNSIVVEIAAAVVIILFALRLMSDLFAMTFSVGWPYVEQIPGIAGAIRQGIRRLNFFGAEWRSNCPAHGIYHEDCQACRVGRWSR